MNRQLQSEVPPETEENHQLQFAKNRNRGTEIPPEKKDRTFTEGRIVPLKADTMGKCKEKRIPSN